MKVCAVVPAAGLGLRLKSSVAKPLTLIDSEPIIIHTLAKLSMHPLIDEIVVVFNANDLVNLKDLISKKGIKKIKEVVEGGPTRKHSVRNALRHVSSDVDLILIHDGVRPFIEENIITNAINAARENGACVVGLPVKATIKKVNLKDLEVDSTLKREEVWEIQTPQVFKKDIILKAYHNAEDKEAPDDAFLVEKLGHRVVLVLGSSLNIKITTPEDLVLAKAILNISN